MYWVNKREGDDDYLPGMVVNTVTVDSVLHDDPETESRHVVKVLKALVEGVAVLTLWENDVDKDKDVDVIVAYKVAVGIGVH
jgi:hypothetical protein